MAYQIKRTDDFLLDLDETYLYLTGVLCSQQAALKLRNAIVVAVDNLRANPFMMHVSYNSELAEKDCREYPVHHYVIVYRIHGEEVLLLRLFHQSQLKRVRR